MINGIKESLLEDQKLDEEMDMLSEMVMDDDDDDKMLDVDDTVISPDERKKLDAVLKDIPDTIEDTEAITKKDIKSAKKVADPTVDDLSESTDIQSLVEALLK